MGVIIHGADLHLSRGEKIYGLGVLREIVEITRRSKAKALLLCGDIFDSFEDMEVLRHDFREILRSLPDSCRVIYLPGNHEALERGRTRQGKSPLENFDFGKALLIGPGKISRIGPEENLPGVEYLAVARDTGSGFRAWKIPPKRAKYRIMLGHGSVPGIGFPDLHEERGREHRFDPEFFPLFAVDYAAMGHLHTFSADRLGSCDIVYPGSARVWRKGERSPRVIILIRTDDSEEGKISWEPVSLPSAGEYRKIRLPLNPDGTGEIDFSRFSETDYLDIELSGVVEDEGKAAAVEAALLRRGARGVRKIEVSRKGIAVLSGVSSHPLVKEFLSRWKHSAPADGTEGEMEVWYKTRELGLLEIKKYLEAGE